MKTLLIMLASISMVGCAGLQTKTQLEMATDQCIYGTVVPRNIPDTKRRAYINKVAVPACLRARGYDVAVSELSDL